MRAPIDYISTLSIDKNGYHDLPSLQAKLSIEFERFVLDRLSYFQSFEVVKVYYDYGQQELSVIVTGLFQRMLHAEIKRIDPSDYRLFQLADFACTIELIALKKKNGNMSHSESMFFNKKSREFEKQFLREVRRKAFLSDQNRSKQV